MNRREPVRRKTPLRAKSVKRRKSKGEPCSTLRCKRRPEVAGMCKTHAMKLADRLFSLQVRAVGVCQLRAMRPETKCMGVLQCCHIISRRYRAIRWDRANALAGCAAHHRYYTDRPLEWERDCRAAGIDYTNLVHCAVNDSAPDLADVLDELRKAA